MKLSFQKYVWPFFAAVLFVFGAYLFVIHASRTILIDFNLYLEAAKDLANRNAIYGHSYEIPAENGQAFKIFYLYPPLLATLLSPFREISHDALNLTWCIISFACIVATTCVFYQLSRQSWLSIYHPWARATTIFFFIICFEPIYWGIREGQIDAIILLCLSLFLMTYSGSQYFIAGVVLAFASWLKISPVLLLILPLMRKQYKVVGGFIAGSAICLLLIISQFGSTALLDFIANFSTISSGELLSNYTFNFSIFRSINKIAEQDLAGPIKYCILLAILALAFKISRTKQDNSAAKGEQISLLILLMILGSPILWFHHLCWAIIPLFVAVISRYSKEERPRRLVHILGLYFLLSQSNLIFTWFYRQQLWVDLAALTPFVLLFLLFLLIYSDTAGGKVVE